MNSGIDNSENRTHTAVKPAVYLKILATIALICGLLTGIICSMREDFGVNEIANIAVWLLGTVFFYMLSGVFSRFDETKLQIEAVMGLVQKNSHAAPVIPPETPFSEKSTIGDQDLVIQELRASLAAMKRELSDLRDKVSQSQKAYKPEFKDGALDIPIGFSKEIDFPPTKTEISQNEDNQDQDQDQDQDQEQEPQYEIDIDQAHNVPLTFADEHPAKGIGSEMATAIKTDSNACIEGHEIESKLKEYESQINDYMCVSRYADALEIARELQGQLPDNEKVASLLMRVKSESESFVVKNAERLAVQIRLYADKRQWRNALECAGQLTEKYPETRQAGEVRLSMSAIIDNARLEEVREYRDRILALMDRRQYVEAMDLAVQVVGRYPETTAAAELRSQMPTLRELATNSHKRE